VNRTVSGAITRWVGVSHHAIETRACVRTWGAAANTGAAIANVLANAMNVDTTMELGRAALTLIVRIHEEGAQMPPRRCDTPPRASGLTPE